MYDFFAPFYIPMEYEERIPFLGSGIAVTKNNLILTNYHVVEGARDFFITMPDGQEVKAELVGADSVLDVAVLRYAGKTGCKPAETGDSDALRLGEWVLAVGNPFGSLIGDPHPTVTVGVVSALKRSFNPEEGRRRVYQNMIQTDAAINPGNSGGALVDAQGRVVGLNTFIFTSSGGSNGIGFAIPINRAMRVIEEVEKFGRVRQLRADMEILDINRRVAAYLGLRSATGAFVRSIDRGGPADKAGVEAGDVILEIDGQPCETADTFWTLFAAHYVGDQIAFTIWRDGKKKNVTYVMAEGQER